MISKVFEKVVFRQVYDYFDENNLLYKNQYGFRKKHSTELAGLEFHDKIVSELEKSKLPLAIFLDLSKAFDTIDHEIMLQKLQYYGITGVCSPMVQKLSKGPSIIVNSFFLYANSIQEGGWVCRENLHSRQL